MQVQLQDTGYQSSRTQWIPQLFPKLSCQSYSNQAPNTNCLRLEFRFTNWLLRLNNWNSVEISDWDLTLATPKLNPPFVVQNQQVNCTAPPVIQMEIANWPPRALYGILCLVSHCLIDLWMEFAISLASGVRSFEILGKIPGTEI